MENKNANSDPKLITGTSEDNNADPETNASDQTNGTGEAGTNQPSGNDDDKKTTTPAKPKGKVPAKSKTPAKPKAPTKPKADDGDTASKTNTQTSGGKTSETELVDCTTLMKVKRDGQWLTKGEPVQLSQKEFESLSALSIVKKSK